MLSDEQRHHIAQKRIELLEQTALRPATPAALQPWLPLLTELREQGTPYELEYLFCTTDDALYRQWLSALEAPPLEALSIKAAALKKESLHDLHHRVQQLYPTISAEHYQPALTYQKEAVPAAGAAGWLEGILAFLGLQQEELYLFSPASPPVLRLAAPDLLRHTTALLQLEEVCILSADLQRMVFRSPGGEWWWGEHYPYAELYPTDTPRYYVYWTTSGTPEMDDLFSVAAPAIGAPFDYDHLLAAEDRFLHSGADTALYLIRGKDLWIEVLFEAHESYYGWHCYTCRRELVDEWKAYFKQLGEAARGG